MEDREKEIVVRLMVAALSSGKSWEKANHNASQAYFAIEGLCDYIENCARAGDMCPCCGDYIEKGHKCR